LVSRRIGKILTELEQELIEAGLSEEQATSIVDGLEDSLDDLGVIETESSELSDDYDEGESDSSTEEE
jgi:hypothetical protein